jgi:hypothetical protein
MDTKSKYVDMMIYFLFVKGVVELGYNTYNSGLWNLMWINSQSIYYTDIEVPDSQKQLNPQENDITTHKKDTNESEIIKTHKHFLHLDGIDGHNEDIIHTNKFDETIPESKHPKYSSSQEITPIMSAVNGEKKNGEKKNGWGWDISGFLEVPSISTPVYDKVLDDIVIVPEITYPWFNSSKRGIVKMNLDHSLDTFKPFNNTSLDTVKAYDDDILDILDTSTPNVSLYGKIDTIDEYLYKKCAEISNKNNQLKSVDFKIIPDHFKNIMSSNQKSAFTHKSSEYTNKKMIQTVNFIKTCT